MKKIKACGVILFRREPQVSFLLMRHAHRWDLPKGHLEPGETDLECALREMDEETGIAPKHVEIDADFCFDIEYVVRVKRFDHQPRRKRLRMFLGWIDGEHRLTLTEHQGAEWFDWSPPHQIQEATIDPLLAAVASHFSTHGQ